QRKERMTEHIRIENRDNILNLTFARPDKKNALTNAMYGALADALIAAETDPAARVIVMKGEGDMFTSGNDVGEFAAIAAGAVQGERHVSRFLQALVQSTVPLERLHAEAASVAARLAKLPAGSLSATKRLMRNPAVLTAQIGAESHCFAERLKTAEAREAFTAFAERRAPDFTKVA